VNYRQILQNPHMRHAEQWIFLIPIYLYASVRLKHPESFVILFFNIFWTWRVRASGLERRVVWRGPDVSEEYITFSLPPASASFLLDLHFDLDDGGDMFFRNVWLSPNCTALQARRLRFIVTAVRAQDPTCLEQFTFEDIFCPPPPPPSFAAGDNEDTNKASRT
jgi:hypothetical protein